MRLNFQLIKDNYLLISILAVAAILRLFRLDYQSIWLDEIHTMIESNPKYGFGEVYNQVQLGEQMPPLYFFIINILFKIFGYSPIVLRAFSALIGIVSVYYTYRLGEKIFSRRAGLIASAILAVNGFHIYYSQEGRPYIFLYLFVVVSFLALLSLIRKPTIKTGAIHGLSAALMLYGHFVALTTLFAQYLIVLFFIVKEKDVHERKKLFTQSFVSGLISLILFIPALKTLFNISKITHFWIPKPTPDAYILIFKEFFGSSKMILPIIYIAIVIYFVKVFFQKEQDDKDSSAALGNKYKFTFIVFSVWIVVSVIIPLVRSYVSVPMIISRYFITVVPAILLIVAIGISQIKIKFIQASIVATCVLFSLINLIVEKRYYSSASKAQFREVAEFIKANNKDNAPVVTTLAWQYSYFFPNQITESSIDNYVSAMKGSGSTHSFWYTNAHTFKLEMNGETSKYLQENFDLSTSTSLFGAWANFYKAKNGTVNTGNNLIVDLTTFSPIASKNHAGLEFYSLASSKSAPIQLKKGKYTITFTGASYPEKPLNGENAHFKVKANGSDIGGFYLGVPGSGIKPTLPLSVDNDMPIILELTFDNDALVGDIDRNGIIHGITITPQE